MLIIPAGRQTTNPTLLCALIAVTALLFWTMAQLPAHSASPDNVAVAQIEK